MNASSQTVATNTVSSVALSTKADATARLAGTTWMYTCVYAYIYIYIHIHTLDKTRLD